MSYLSLSPKVRKKKGNRSQKEKEGEHVNVLMSTILSLSYQECNVACSPHFRCTKVDSWAKRAARSCHLHRNPSWWELAGGRKTSMKRHQYQTGWKRVHTMVMFAKWNSCQVYQWGHSTWQWRWRTGRWSSQCGKPSSVRQIRRRSGRNCLPIVTKKKKAVGRGFKGVRLSLIAHSSKARNPKTWDACYYKEKRRWECPVIILRETSGKRGTRFLNTSTKQMQQCGCKSQDTGEKDNEKDTDLAQDPLDGCHEPAHALAHT